MAKEKYYDPLSDMAMIKESLMSLFCDTEDITRLIMPQLDNDHFTFEENWYGGTFDKNIYGKTEIETLVGHCFDTPYIEGTVTDNRCAVFIETYLTRAENPHFKQVGVDIVIIAHKDAVKLSDDDKKYYKSIGVYGNRVDSAVQVINSAINNEQIMNAIKKKYSIGNLAFSERNPIKEYAPGTKFYGKCLSYVYDTFYQRKDYVR